MKILLFLVLTPLMYGANLGCWGDTSINQNGVGFNASITISLNSTPAIQAQIYQDSQGVLGKQNPFNSNSNGRFSFCAIPGQYIISVSGQGITTYQYVVTLTCPLCAPGIIGTVNTLGQTSSLGLANINYSALSVGLYRITWRMRSTAICSSVGSAGVVLGIAWSDELISNTNSFSSMPLGATSTYGQQGQFILWNGTSGGNVQYQTTYTACTTGTGTYDLQLSLEKLQ